MSQPAQLQQDRGNKRLKFLDRYAGIPVIALLGAKRRLSGRRSVPTDWKTIGLVKTVGIGDTVLLSGIVHDVRTARPDARIVLFVSANNAGFAHLLDDVDEVVTLPVRDIAGAVRMVRARHCDVIVDFGAWPRLESLFTVLAGARCAIGMRTPGQHRHFAYDIVVDHSDGHEVENYRRLIAAAGIESTSSPSLTPNTKAARIVTAPYAVLHLWPGGANFAERSWPEDRWRRLAEELNARGLDVVLTGGPGDVAPNEAIIARWGADGIRVHSSAGASPAETLVVLSDAVGVVSVNTGVMHLAAALAAPVVALNGPTPVKRWGPVGGPSRALVSPTAPNGYLNLGWEHDERYATCMQDITLAAVIAAWDDLMHEVGSAPSQTG
jgi:ADP-heptose:LPS heptosyltransferase